MVIAVWGGIRELPWARATSKNQNKYFRLKAKMRFGVRKTQTQGLALLTYQLSPLSSDPCH